MGRRRRWFGAGIHRLAFSSSNRLRNANRSSERVSDLAFLKPSRMLVRVGATGARALSALRKKCAEAERPEISFGPPPIVVREAGLHRDAIRGERCDV